jgi:CysZ protein
MESHRRLMQRVHPDRGGSAFLAQQLNEARRVLLDEGKA